MKRALQGLSLLEIVISIAILVMLFFTTYEIFIAGFRYYKATQVSSELIRIAQKEMERIVSERNAVSTPWQLITDSYRYMCAVQLVTVTGSHVDYEMYDVTITVEGPLNPDGSAGSLTRSITLNTIIAPSQSFYPEYCGRERSPRGGSIIFEREAIPSR
ncbi:MAG: hypothetical protein RDV48_27725 [Candidatus Eremiobacteraeota bacterium]|nr:hypothetical protein [Candidatus Eremiobacteraeota bacterium]